jgi:hypothetical protein
MSEVKLPRLTRDAMTVPVMIGVPVDQCARCCPIQLWDCWFRLDLFDAADLAFRVHARLLVRCGSSESHTPAFF